RPGHLGAFVGVVAGGVHVGAAARAGHPPRHLGYRGQGPHQEALAVAAPGLHVVGVADRAHAGDVAGQRDHPDPAVLVAVDADVAGVDAGPPLHAVEVAEQGRRLVAHVLALETAAGAEEGVAAAGVHHVAGAPGAGAARALGGDQARAAGQRLHVHHPDLLPGVHAVAGGVLERHAVELRAQHLEGVVSARVHGAREPEHVVVAAVGR